MAPLEEEESGAKKGYSAPIVKTENAEGEPDVPDYGDDNEESGAATSQAAPVATTPVSKVEAPARAMPDYTDLCDDDDTGPAPEVGIAKKEEVDRAKGERRPDAILVSGANRLQRGHLAEIFASKRLPSFHSLEWIADHEVICVFDTAEAAARSLAGALAGFDQAGEDRPGPGLWRAQRGMLDFREATVADAPAADFKRQHRAGRQVRDYRFWEAAKEIDGGIMDAEEAKGNLKRAAPSGEDAIAAAVLARELEPPAKKRRKSSAQPIAPKGEEEEAPDILTQMAKQDKEIIGLKQEPEDQPHPAPAVTGEMEFVHAVPEIHVEETWENSWFSKKGDDDDNGRRRRKKIPDEDAWGRHAQIAQEDPEDRRGKGRGKGKERDNRGREDWDDWYRDQNGRGRDWNASRRGGRDNDDWDRGRRWSHEDRGGGGGRDSGRKRQWEDDRRGGGRQEDRDRARPRFSEVDDDEKKKRQRRMDRFINSSGGSSRTNGESTHPEATDV
eukprot:TRINITY_DN21954_c0_g1_i1.p1 TRINITY_DN21954_c0_g1~~TRINITY_DN21954_c0_g1_i1.p1  ORF type:complete len:516 (+),score=129.64 TRINITY_DN21954_c0_g1_i1:51-1550(+)